MVSMTSTTSQAGKKGKQMTVTIKKHMEDTDFWSSIMGGTEFVNEWWLKVRYHGESNWDKPGSVTITALDGETDEPVSKTLTIEDLVTAYEAVIAKPYYHCGGTIDIDDMDECASDIVLQQAMFGDVVYG
jgi:hypothetical protein